jgi:transketolase
MIAPLRTQPGPAIALREAYGQALVELAASNPRVVALDADLMSSTKMDRFAQRFPERFFQVGISEADLIGVAAGLAREGFIPFASSFAIFATGKAYDQIRQSVCYSGNPVKIVASHAGLQSGAEGASHQALEDLALMRALPRMTVIVPGDAIEARKAIFAAAEWPGPVYIRLDRQGWPVLFDDSYEFRIGRSARLCEGADLTIIACGSLLWPALAAADTLAADGISARVVDMATIKPLDEDSVIAAAAETGAIVTAEEHQINGGLGEAVARVVATHRPVPMEFVAVNDAFGASGAIAELMARYGLTASNVISSARTVLARKG